MPWVELRCCDRTSPRYALQSSWVHPHLQHAPQALEEPFRKCRDVREMVEPATSRTCQRRKNEEECERTTTRVTLMG